MRRRASPTRNGRSSHRSFISALVSGVPLKTCRNQFSGFSYPLREPTEIGDAVHSRFPVHIFNQDPTLAPPGKTSLVVMLPQQLQVLERAGAGPGRLPGEERQVRNTVVACLEQRFPGISDQVEMVDVSTP